MTRHQWNLVHDLNEFDLGSSGAAGRLWAGRKALYFENVHTYPVLVKEKTELQAFRLQAQVAVPGPNGFIGLVFGARDTQNYELVYLSPGDGDAIGEIQYDPVMNGSSTWQISHVSKVTTG